MSNRAGIVAAIAASVLFGFSTPACAADGEISLFNGAGKPEAYIALDDDMTIYLWNGKPVAYLEKSGGDYNVYGFNGNHLGWFAKGAIWGHDGNAVCAVKDVLSVTQIEPIKSIREIDPIRSISRLEPLQPLLSGKFGETPCRALLEEGR